eukprot:365855-Chlamydomonas_euryale.AAC.10
MTRRERRASRPPRARRSIFTAPLLSSSPPPLALALALSLLLPLLTLLLVLLSSSLGPSSRTSAWQETRRVAARHRCRRARPCTARHASPWR